jgi:hypothetical protein
VCRGVAAIGQRWSWVPTVHQACRAASPPRPTPVTHVVYGTFEFDSAKWIRKSSGSGCYGVGDFADVRDGAIVVVKDEVGAILGQAQLAYNSARSTSKSCVFGFNVTVAEASSYEFDFGQRTGDLVTIGKLTAAAWSATFTLKG